MRVAALELPRLPWQVVRRDRPALSELPVAIVAREGSRELVLAASPAALALGVVEGASVAQVRAGAPGLTFLPREPAREAEVLAQAAEALLALAPFVELAPPDALLLDPSGARFVPASALGTAPPGAPPSSLLEDVDPGWPERRAQETAWAQAVLGTLADLGLAGRMAIADTVGAARLLAGEADPVRLVAPQRQVGAVATVPLARVARLGRETEAAAELQVPGTARDSGARLFPVLSSSSVELLEALGVRRLGDVRGLPPRALVDRLGTDAEVLLLLARGGQPRPLVAYWPRTALVERFELEAPVESADRLVFALRPLVERLEVRLAGRGESVTRLGLVVELEAAGLEDAAPASGVGIPRRQRVERTIDLARPAASANVLHDALRDRLSAWALPAPVVACALEVKEATRRGQQLELGERPAAVEALEGVLARLSARLGPDAVGSPRAVPQWLPERAVARRPFQPGPVRARGFERVDRAAVEARAKERHGGEVPGSTPVSAGLRLIGGAPPEGGEAGTGAPSTEAPRIATGRGAGPPGGEAGERVLSRPTRLFAPEGLAPELDAHGAVRTVAWRGRVHRVVRRTRPERLATGWWSDAEVRDYATWLLADGTRLWVFRDPDGRWWAQGIHD